MLTLHLTQFALERTVISLLGGALHQARWRARLARAYAREKRITETLQRSLLLKIPVGRFDGLDVASFHEAAGEVRPAGAAA